MTFEGTEGAGKSTQAKLLYEYLCTKRVPCILTREPGGTMEAELIRNMLTTQSSFFPETELLLINAARFEHWTRLIKPHLDQGYWVICDRFLDSTLAYQGFGLGVDLDLITKTHELFLPKVYPDKTFLLLIDPQESLRRATDHNRYERLSSEFHQRVYEGFQVLSEQDRMNVLDATQTIEACFEDIQATLSFST